MKVAALPRALAWETLKRYLVIGALALTTAMALVGMPGHARAQQNSFTVNLSASFTGDATGDVGGVFYLPNAGVCPPTFTGSNCVEHVTPVSGTVTGVVTVTPTAAPANSPPSEAMDWFNLNGTFTVNSSVGNASASSSQQNLYIPPSCQANLLVACLSLYEPAGYELTPNYLNVGSLVGQSSATLPITFPGTTANDLNFPDSIEVGIPGSPYSANIYAGSDDGASFSSQFCSDYGGTIVNPAGLSFCVIGSVTGSATFSSSLTCQTILASLPSGMKVFPGGTPSGTGLPTTMNAVFIPVDGLTLANAAQLCGYTGFNWSQTITNLPSEVSSLFAPANGGPTPSTPVNDPVAGGWAYQEPNLCLAGNYGFYFDPTPGATVCPLSAQELSASAGSGATILDFNDTPQAPCSTALWILNGDSCFNPGDFVDFTTTLVGMLPGGGSVPLDSFNWIDDYSAGVNFVCQTFKNCPSTGGVGTLDADTPVTPGGTGGVILLSIDGVPVSNVPEPASIVLFGAGLAGLGVMRRRKRGES